MRRAVGIVEKRIEEDGIRGRGGGLKTKINNNWVPGMRREKIENSTDGLSRRVAKGQGRGKAVACVLWTCRRRWELNWVHKLQLHRQVDQVEYLGYRGR